MSGQAGKERYVGTPEQLAGFKPGYSAEAVYKEDYKEDGAGFVKKVNKFLERVNAENVSIVGLLPLGEYSEVKSPGEIKQRTYSDTVGVLFVVHNPQIK